MAVTARAEERPAGSTETAEVAIGLPAGVAPAVGVTFGDGAIALDLPQGAIFPVDFVRASGGLLRSTELQQGPPGRVKLTLRLAGGICDGVRFDASALKITLSRRFSGAPEGHVADHLYRLGPEDKIQIAVAGHPEISGQFVVGGSGKITAPLVGEINAAGMTARDLAGSLTELLARDYLVDPQVDIQVLEYKSQWVLVTGEVRAPGRIALRAAATLKEVLADAGGMTSEAGFDVVISRGQDREGGVTIRVDREKFERGEENPAVIHGDMVNVAPVAYVFMEGQVRTPGKVRIERGMTLLKAIAMSGGLTEWANAKSVQVIRKGAKTPETYNLRDIEKLEVEDPLLAGGEIVVVRKRFL